MAQDVKTEKGPNEEPEKHTTMTFRLSRKVLRRIKIHCVENDITIGKFFTDILDEHGFR